VDQRLAGHPQRAALVRGVPDPRRRGPRQPVGDCQIGEPPPHESDPDGREADQHGRREQNEKETTGAYVDPTADDDKRSVIGAPSRGLLPGGPKVRA
jgi:hypothetical protein